MKNQNLCRYGTQHTTAKLFVLMKDGKRRSIAQAAVDLGLTESPVYSAVKKLRAQGEIRICAWSMSPVNGRFIAIWVIGKGADAPKPPRDEWMRPTRGEDEHTKRLAEELARPAFRHWTDVALFGPYEARA